MHNIWNQLPETKDCQSLLVMLSEHQPGWKAKYLMEKTVIEKAVGKENIVRIHHFGSTAVAGLVAKPTIDILLEIRENVDLDTLLDNLGRKDYFFDRQAQNATPPMILCKGYLPQEFEGQPFHLYVRYPGDYDELYFRDYLVSHPDAAAEYGRLKQELARQYRYDCGGYADAKGEFIRKITALARRESELMERS